MAHITFIHGISNKPPADELLAIWKRTLSLAAHPIDFSNDVTCDMVYWADVLYAEPSEGSQNESVAGLERLETISSEDVPVELSQKTGEEAEWIRSMEKRLGLGFDENTDPDLLPEGSFREGMERIPLPWGIKKIFLKRFLRDVHHYLFNDESEPRPGEKFRVQTEIRKRFLDKLAIGVAKPGPHIVVSHSMGTVIAYDCLKRVRECPSIDGLLTIGSPLGIDEIQDKLEPEHTREDGFPHERLQGAWANIFDHLDVVARADPKLANDYKKGGAKEISDESQRNNGFWRHDAVEYLHGEEVSLALSKMISPSS